MMINSDSPVNEFPSLSPGEIRAGLHGGMWGRVYFFETVDSTNERALALPTSELRQSGVVLVAESQTKGRGRHGRGWISPAGRNIYLSAVLRPAFQPRDATLLTVIAAVSSAVALRKTTGLEVTIKWPNDLFFGGRKIGGILTELRSGPEGISRAVIGIGMNVNSEATDFPEELRGIATSVREETGEIFSRTEIIIETLNELESWYGRFLREGRFPVLEEWKRLSTTIGKKVRVVLGKEVISGVAEAIDEEGMLLVRLRTGETRKISAGDVTELR
jgi:BirA family biotin operon repressor/biotin-[acetyl-CoA-carboxylase] ligase